MAFLLCLSAVAQAVNGIPGIVRVIDRFPGGWAGDPMPAVWNLIVGPAVHLAASLALPCFLFSVWWAKPEPAL